MDAKAHVGPSFIYSQPRKDKRPGMTERQVTVTNPDGTTTTHTFWTDANVMPGRVAWPEDEDRGLGGGRTELFAWSPDL